MNMYQTMQADTLPTLYQYYTNGGIKYGLDSNQNQFTLNGKNITLYSGAMHYFRTPKQLWRDRLKKMRAAGLNTVETYVPWNLHEPTPGVFDFGQGGTDMQDFLDIETFLKTAQEEDLFAILRPGPYICAEWEFGGFPSWLLREKDIKFRTSDEKYMGPVRRFFNTLLPILAALQFINGGPIIMFQVENEYGSTKTVSRLYKNKYIPRFSPDKDYLRELRNIYVKNNITELMATADGVTTFGTAGTITDLFLVTANFGDSPKESFDALQSIQPNRSKMAMEYYPGWFDHWGEEHHTTSVLDLIMNIELIIAYPGSFNIYMFHGGTSFGFMNGANLNNELTDNSGYQPDTTSYDYDSPLTEAGDYTLKYNMIKLILEKHGEPKTKIPDPPASTPRVAYESVKIVEYIPMKDFIDSQNTSLTYQNTIPMELLDINNNTGQSYGYIVYRKSNLNLTSGDSLTIQGHVCDTVLVLVNGQLISPVLKSATSFNKFGYWRLANSTITLADKDIQEATVDLVVENWGRVNYGKLPQYYQYKGLWQGDVLIGDKIINNWQHIPLEFKKSQNMAISQWKSFANNTGPGLYKGYLNVETPQDTYINMEQWTKGIVMVNGFVLGRYAVIGPQQCLYLPAPLLKQGENSIIIFEHFSGVDNISFSKDQIWNTIP